MSASRSRRTLLRYTLFQIPGWLFIGALMIIGVAWWNLPIWAASVGFLLWVVKDAALYPLVRKAYEPPVPVAEEQMVGLIGEAKGSIAPSGYVQVRGELWKAELIGADPIPAGEAVRIVGVRGLTLLVSREPGGLFQA